MQQTHTESLLVSLIKVVGTRLGQGNGVAEPGNHGVLCLQSSTPCSLNSWKVPNVWRRLEGHLSCACGSSPPCTCVPRGSLQYLLCFFPMAVLCSEIIPFNFGHLSCVSTIHPFGEESFSPGLKTGGFYFLAESPWILLRTVITFLELGCIYNGVFVPLWLSALNNRPEGWRSLYEKTFLGDYNSKRCFFLSLKLLLKCHLEALKMYLMAPFLLLIA